MGATSRRRREEGLSSLHPFPDSCTEEELLGHHSKNRLVEAQYSNMRIEGIHERQALRESCTRDGRGMGHG
jgi:hypothetical protein